MINIHVNHESILDTSHHKKTSNMTGKFFLTDT